MTSTTEMLRDDVLQIRKDLRSGALSNSVARTLLVGAKIALDTLRAEMEATRLGAAFQPIEFHSADRNQARTLKAA